MEIDLNPKFEKAIFVGADKNKGFEFGYAVGIYCNYWRPLSPGVEAYGGIGLIDDSDPVDEQQHYVFPVVRGELGRGSSTTSGSASASPAAPITSSRAQHRARKARGRAVVTQMGLVRNSCLCASKPW
jgi:hypothetical protein